MKEIWWFLAGRVLCPLLAFQRFKALLANVSELQRSSDFGWPGTKMVRILPKEARQCSVTGHSRQSLSVQSKEGAQDMKET